MPQIEPQNPSRHSLLSKVPEVTLFFWIIKICATTVGETGGDALSMSLNLGYALSSLIFLSIFFITICVQVSAKRYHPFFYWAVVVATTTAGTTMSDFLDRTAGLGYIYSSITEFACVLAVLLIWRLTTGKIEFQHITSRKNEIFYWLTILIANTLGTALGDFTADDLALGFSRGAALFGALIAVVAALHYFTRIPKAILFWSAYVLTRPLGATMGDILTKPKDEGGLDLSRISSSLTIAALMILLILCTTCRAERTSP
ncbi:MAG TPA: hypothetical protein VFE58_16700 [Tepidisphaeraceae bacterium]|jgi:uncharacterized membrane-anchored protein|nr:hypothetical protein [Tepidisphaeraceae bacterium]